MAEGTSIWKKEDLYGEEPEQPEANGGMVVVGGFLKHIKTTQEANPASGSPPQSARPSAPGSAPCARDRTRASARKKLGGPPFLPSKTAFGDLKTPPFGHLTFDFP